MIVTYDVRRFLLRILQAIYEHYVRRSYNFASESYPRKALRFLSHVLLTRRLS